MPDIIPGVHDLDFAAYLRDPCPEPSLTASIAHMLVERSPAHAWHRYHADRAYRRDAAIGTVFHALFLGSGGEYEVIDADDFRTKAAREARDVALEEGKTPIKAADFRLAEHMVEAADEQLEHHELGNFTNRPGNAEQTLIWREHNGIWCRARPDWMPDDLEAAPYIVNVKTSTCAHPDVWIRRAYEAGYDLSAAHYCRGVRELLGHEVAELFVVVETEPPHGLSVIMLDGEAMALAEKKRAGAVRLWADVVRGERPGYPTYVCHVGAPGYKAAQIEERAALGHYGEAA